MSICHFWSNIHIFHDYAHYDYAQYTHDNNYTFMILF